MVDFEGESENDLRKGRNGSDDLIVLVHGFRGNRTRMSSVVDAIDMACPKADIFFPLLPYAGNVSPFLVGDPAAMAAYLVRQIDRIVGRRGRYRRIIFVGYSAGALIARRAIVIAKRRRSPGPGLEPLPIRPWSLRITRLVLLAGVTRGWTFNSAASWMLSTGVTILTWIAETVGRGRGFLLAYRAGAPFIVQTRLEWFALARARQAPSVVQLLGTVDDIVAPEDNVDLATDGANRRFLMLQVPRSGHVDILDMPALGNAEQCKRRQLFTDALTRSVGRLRAGPDYVSPERLTDSLPPKADNAVKHVVFVIHGIRDRGFWTHKIASEIKRAAGDDPAHRVQSKTGTYGYFAMGPFLLPWIRARKVAWLMDLYADTRASFPEAEISYVGHSNGSYLITGALRNYEVATFRKVVLAGSVVRSDFDWRRYLEAGRIQGLMNYVATRDIVVAGFPKAFQRMNLFGLGGGGHDGFHRLFARPDATRQSDQAEIRCTNVGGHDCHEVRFTVGGHSAGIVESQWDDIANFVVSGRAPNATDLDFAAAQPRWIRVMAAVQPLPLLLLVGIVILMIAGGWAIHWVLGMAMMAAALVLLTRF